ncbi:ribose transport system ATP-binding protein [Alkalispirochaeta americana]|uniref:Ribose transport system ATP-binding protein n=1 Tax=Alkalispirochaeta americana TaxID=159291 RepID=A0A1N6ULJ4_9SPIO|nr:sugar ABC transporter ATP-binding protein [Alkalispirochaeta americana]SIQ66489.1 ribose transport system ATP-binding protein [Alkalispirochaeta americana]
MIPLLEVRNLTRRYSGGFLISRVNMTVLPGEVHAVVGENGSGKSALMKLLSGFEHADAGQILFEGRELTTSSIGAARRAGIVYQHQDLQLFENLSVAENIFFATGTGRYSHLQTLIKCQDLFSQTGISLDPSLLLGTLGYAEKQLVAVAKTLATPAKLFIFDEPTSAMSEAERSVVFSIIARLRQKKAGIIYISHRLDDIQRISDRVTVIHGGRRVATSAAQHVDKSSLIHLMTGENPRRRYPRTPGKAGKTILTVKDLKSSPVLSSVSFSLGQGEILGITGLMGSGRTRLAHCLAGEHPLEGGHIFLSGKEEIIRDPAKALSLGIALVPENRIEEALFPYHSLSVNMSISSLNRFRTLHGIDQNTLLDRISSYTRRFSIRPGDPSDAVKLYSGGNQQKIILARAFMNRPKIFLLDEPTRGIDVAAKVDMYNAIDDLVSKGASLILFSSEIDEILGMADRTLVLSQGRIAGELSREESTREKILDLAIADHNMPQARASGESASPSDRPGQEEYRG